MERRIICQASKILWTFCPLLGKEVLEFTHDSSHLFNWQYNKIMSSLEKNYDISFSLYVGKIIFSELTNLATSYTLELVS